MHCYLPIFKSSDHDKSIASSKHQPQVSLLYVLAGIAAPDHPYPVSFRRLELPQPLAHSPSFTTDALSMDLA